MKKTLQLMIPLLLAGTLQAQTTTDGLMMGKGSFCTGFMATHNTWKNYWEGTHKQYNGNMGTITTNNVMWFGNYGVTDKLNIMASVPYITTNATGGTWHNMKGIQDLTLAVKYKFFQKSIDSARFRAFVVGTLATPITNYDPDYLPLSIGLHSKQAGARLNLNYFSKAGWYVNGSLGYTFRGNVTLDRPAYFTDGQEYYTNKVDMPNVLDYTFSVGYIARGLETKVSYMQQNTQGGGDIRSWDVPFASYRMNFSKAELLMMYYLPKPKNFAVRGSYSYTVAGRNVGQSSTVLAGILYTFHFFKNQ